MLVVITSLNTLTTKVIMLRFRFSTNRIILVSLISIKSTVISIESWILTVERNLIIGTITVIRRITVYGHTHTINNIRVIV